MEVIFPKGLSLSIVKTLAMQAFWCGQKSDPQCNLHESEILNLHNKLTFKIKYKDINNA